MAIPIVFSPAIGEALHIAISEARTPSDTLTLVFKANLGEEDYTRLTKGHIRVQLWSNLPTTPSAPQDLWTAFDFQVVPDQQLVSRPPNGRWVNLTAIDQGEPSSAQGQLALEIPVDLSTFSGDRRYGFTYRIVYGDGGIVWLGTHGRDGVAVLTETKVAGVELGDGWKQAQGGIGGQGLVHDVRDDSTQGQGIAKFLTIGNYHVWSFDKNLSLHSSSSGSAQDALSLVMLPCKPGTSQLNPPAYVLSTSGGTLLGISSSTGVITSTGPGSVHLQTCYDPKQLPVLVSNALTHSGMADKVRVVKGEQWVLLLSPREQSPAKGLFIPTSRSPKKQSTIPLDFAALAEILTSPLKEVVPPEFCIFSPSTQDFEYVDTRRTVESIAEADSEVGFGVPSHGGEFALSRVYDLTGQEDDSKCKISLLTSHDNVSIPQPTGTIAKPIILPTPPPSPFMSHRNARASPAVTFSPDPVIIPRVDTIDIDGQVLRRRPSASRKPTKEPELPEKGLLPEKDQAPSSKEGSEIQRQPEGRTASVIRRRGLLSLFKGIISIVRVYTGAVFYLFYLLSLGPLFGRRSPRVPESPAKRNPATPPTDAGEEAREGEGDDVLESGSAGTGASFNVGKEESDEESDDSDETSSDVTVTGSDEQNMTPSKEDAPAAEPSPPPEEVKLAASHSDKGTSDDELLSVELHPGSSGKSWARLALMTPRMVKDNSGDVTLASLSKSITVNNNNPDSLALRTLKIVGGKTEQDSWLYHLVEFPVPISSATDTTAMKVLGHA
ncbi:hypothetical protein FA13DRAFT_471105 [Coprinellus micaceus]|uniref:Uncharacterized protein n=1 Tax=Coprinellus micaceus TaxID=71717 RepID=A0A4Y7U0P7_COPMI|nr:hypothetical protein FA13DRAFT_471105 [Coprinellus micaceus]